MLNMLPARIFAAGIVFFAVWTVGANVVALGRLPADALHLALLLAVCAAVLAAAGASFVNRLFGPGRLGLPSVSWRSMAGQIDRRLTTWGVLLGLMFVLAFLMQYKRSQFLPLWLLCLLTATVALARSGVTANTVQLTSRASREQSMSIGVGVLLVAAVLLAFYYLTSIPDADDSLYLNFAVGTLRDRASVFAHDTMLGAPGAAFIKSTYRLESYQLLTATVADLTGLPVILVAHGLIPALALIFTAAVLVLIYRVLFADGWAAGVIAHLLWLTALDGSLQSYGYHAVPRFFQGKAPFVTTMVPLIAILAVMAVREASWPALGLLAAAMIASLGFTANAVFAAPLAAGLAIAPMFLLGDSRRRMLCLRLACTIVYPAALVIYLLLFDPPGPSEVPNAGTVGATLWSMLGSPVVLAGVLVLLFLAAGAAILHKSFRNISLYVLVLLLLVLNPFLWPAYGRDVTGNLNVRLLWAVPLPLILALLTTVGWRSLSRRLALLLGFVLLAATILPSSILHRTSWSPSLLKVPQPQYHVAQAINAQAPPGAVILAPEEIATWIPTFDDARPVVEAREIYLPQRSGEISPDQLTQRKSLFEWINEKRSLTTPAALEALERLDVRVIVVRDDSGCAPIRAVLRQNSDYTLMEPVNGYLVYFRKDVLSAQWPPGGVIHTVAPRNPREGNFEIGGAV